MGGMSEFPKWRLWIDDQALDLETPARHCSPNNDDEFQWEVATSSAEAIKLVEAYGYLPKFIDFDHDLGLNEFGVEDTVKPFCKFIAELFPDSPVPDFNIHSANPDGAAWIRSFMESWRRSRCEETPVSEWKRSQEEES
jgi:hypothetical protein